MSEKINKVFLDRMSSVDVAAVAEIERLSSLTPWTEKQFQEELAKTQSLFIVARSASGLKPVGFCGLWFVAGEAQVANFAVHPDFRRRGLGRSLMKKLESEARLRKAVLMNLEVREDNVAARALYHSEGFRETHRRPRYYQGVETAIMMQKELV